LDSSVCCFENIIKAFVFTLILVCTISERCEEVIFVKKVVVTALVPKCVEKVVVVGVGLSILSWMIAERVHEV